MKKNILTGLIALLCAVSVADEPVTVAVELADDVKLEMIKVEPGTFTMGKRSRRDTTSGSTEMFIKERRITLTREFYLGKYEVTVAQYKAVMGEERHSSSFRGADAPNFPKVGISWYDAMAFCEKLNKAEKAPEGYKFTLPTEAQWEFAASGGNKSLGYMFSGSNRIDDVMHVNRSRITSSSTTTSRPRRRTSNSAVNTPWQVVGKKDANELGFHDMSGNVWEFCLDDFVFDTDNIVPEFSREADDPSRKVRSIRGGDSGSSPYVCRIYYRYRCLAPDMVYYGTGFRLALVPADLEKQTQEEAEKQAVKTETKKPKTAVKPKTPPKKPGGITIDLTDDVKLEMAKIPAGSCRFGEIPKDRSRNYDGKRGEKVNVKAFWLGIFEVTQAQWIAVMGEKNSLDKLSESGPLCGIGDDYPMYYLTWEDAMDFCDRLNAMNKAPEGFKFSLPTDVQWEYAARNAFKGKLLFYSGSNKLEDVAWYAENSRLSTQPVGRKKPNALGLYDMNGNVKEMCLDYFLTEEQRSNNKNRSRDKDDEDDGDGDDEDGSTRRTFDFSRENDRRYAVRGGCWSDYEYVMRLYNRDYNYRRSEGYYTSSGSTAYAGIPYKHKIGFRVALVPAEEENTGGE